MTRHILTALVERTPAKAVEWIDADEPSAPFVTGALAAIADSLVARRVRLQRVSLRYQVQRSYLVEYPVPPKWMKDLDDRYCAAAIALVTDAVPPGSVDAIEIYRELGLGEHLEPHSRPEAPTA